MRPPQDADLRIDEELDSLSAGIWSRLPSRYYTAANFSQLPEVQLRKSKTCDAKSYSGMIKGAPIVILGGGTLPLLRLFCRGVAAFFLPSAKFGKRPSKFWSDARSSLAVALDWSASPLAEPKLINFPLTPRQDQVAEAFAGYTYRFILCHELAHIALGHLDGESSSSSDELTVLRASQDNELAADALGLELQLHSLPDPRQLITALTSSVYFLHFNKLFDDFRLAMLSELVNYKEWNIEYTHPPTLHRLSNLIATAGALEGEVASKGLEKAFYSLSEAVDDIADYAQTHRDRIAANVVRAITTQQARKARSIPSFVRHFEQSPIGVLCALDRLGKDAPSQDAVNSVLEQLPLAISEFYRMTLDERARFLA